LKKMPKGEYQGPPPSRVEKLLKAVEENRLEEVQTILENDKSLINQKAWHGYTPLLVTAPVFDKTMITYLISMGADINARREDEERNASSSPERGSGETLLAMAVINEEVENEFIDFLVDECHADINSQNIEGETPLMAAIDVEDIDRALFLINKKADLSLTDWKRETALMKAIQHNNQLAVVRSLLDNGAEVNAQNDNFYTALHLAVEPDNLEGFRLLLAHGADMNILTPSESTVEKLVKFHSSYKKTKIADFLSFNSVSG